MSKEHFPQLSEQNDGDVLELLEESEIKPPSMYQVILLNDDYTPMEFVVHILERFFSLRQEAAIQVMLDVHTNGRGICGVYTRDIAETKVTQVNKFSRRHQHPLLCSMEEI